MPQQGNVKNSQSATLLFLKEKEAGDEHDNNKDTYLKTIKSWKLIKKETPRKAFSCEFFTEHSFYRTPPGDYFLSNHQTRRITSSSWIGQHTQREKTRIPWKKNFKNVRKSFPSLSKHQIKQESKLSYSTDIPHQSFF